MFVNLFLILGISFVFYCLVAAFIIHRAWVKFYKEYEEKEKFEGHFEAGILPLRIKFEVKENDKLLLD